MLEKNKNQIKDTPSAITSYQAESFHLVSFSKINKLISALYMVTDIMDKEEPLRNKLRTLGTNIISDIHSSDKGQHSYDQIKNRVSEIMSFIEISSSVGIISEMNSNILIKEFIELRKLVTEATPQKTQNWLEEFIKENEEDSNRDVLSKGQTGTRIGVQRGGTLLKAIKNISNRVPAPYEAGGFRLGSDRIPNLNKSKLNPDRQNINVLKDKRHEDIISVIKDKMKNSINFEGVTITDIKTLGQGTLVDCGEKTLQRELVSMVASGILIKTGEKRWSRYMLK